MRPKHRIDYRFAILFAAVMLTLGLVLRFVDSLSNSIFSACFGALTFPAYILAAALTGNLHGGPEITYWLGERRIRMKVK